VTAAGVEIHQFQPSQHFDCVTLRNSSDKKQDD